MKSIATWSSPNSSERHLNHHTWAEPKMCTAQITWHSGKKNSDYHEENWIICGKKRHKHHILTWGPGSAFGGFTKNGILPLCQSLRTILLTVCMSGSPPWKNPVTIYVHVCRAYHLSITCRATETFIFPMFSNRPHALPACKCIKLSHL